MIPFPFEHDGGQDLVERVSFLTDVIEADDGSEQRIAARSAPRVEVELAVLCLDPREGQRLEALLFASQPELLGAPLWQWGGRLAADAGSGATSFSVDVANVPWQAGDTVLLFRDPFTWDALPLLAASPPLSLSTSAPSTRAWPAGTLVCPMRTARLGEVVQQSLEGRDATAARIRLALEPAP